MEEKKLIVDGKRTDGRTLKDLRSVDMKVGILKNAEGSAYIHWGNNKVICGIYGPRECLPRHTMNPYKAVIKCKYSMSPFASKEDHGRSGPSRRSTEISKVIKEVFEDLIMVEKFPRTQIDIFVDVLQADGGTRVASINAASLALVDAGIPMKEMVSAVAAGKVDDQIAVDLGKEEDNSGQSDVPIAFSSVNKDILLLQMDGLLTVEEMEKVLNLSLEASERLDAMQKEALERKYKEKRESFRM